MDGAVLTGKGMIRVLTAKDPQEFGVELLITEAKGTLATWNLAKEALNKWNDDPEALAELAAVLYSAMIRTSLQGRRDFQENYSELLNDAIRRAGEHLSPSFHERFGERFTHCCDEVEKDYSQ